jgi:hypothetical protein
MQVLRPLSDPAVNSDRRVIPENRLPVEVALAEPDALAAAKVNGREDQHEVKLFRKGRGDLKTPGNVRVAANLAAVPAGK